MTQPTGVFVRLPLDEAQIMKLYNPKKSGNENLLAIGTPVTGGELRMRGYEYEVKRQGCDEFSHDVGRSVSSINPAISGIEYRNISPLVSQSDAQAAIAVLEAEITKKNDTIKSLVDEGLKASSLLLAEVKNLEAEVKKALKGPEA